MSFKVLKETWQHLVNARGDFPGGTLSLHFGFMVDRQSVLACWSVRVKLSWDPEFLWENEELHPFGSAKLELVLSKGFLITGKLSLEDGDDGSLRVFTPMLDFGIPPLMQRFGGNLVPVSAGRSEPEPPLPPAPCPPSPPRPPRPEPGAAGPPLIKPASRDSDLFPYLFMRIWPEPPPDAVALHFARGTGEDLGGAFFKDLVSLRAGGMPDAREQMERRAVRYVEDAGGDAPYLQPPHGLTGLMASYPAVERCLREHRGTTPEELLGEVWRCLGVGAEKAREWLDSPEALLLRQRVWQSYCALVISLGFSPSTREALARLMVVDHLLRWLVTPTESPPTLEDLRALAHATVVLPATVFPLPPSGGSPPSSPPREDGWILPYAIGELQMVRRRLVGYALGELAHVESVMAGERRQTTRRKASRTQQSTERVEVTDTRNAREARSGSTSLTESMATTVAANLSSFDYKDFSTAYGPPTTVTLNGGWTWRTQPDGPTKEDGSQFARDVLERVVDQVAHSVSELRSASTLREWEESTVSVLDNTGGTEGRRGLYRWLNEVYRACVVNYGNRLVLEVLLPAPAARYLAAEQDLPDASRPPVPPSAIGFDSYEDIHAGSFAMLSARYPSPELELPPAPRRVSGIARSGVSLELELPEGHAAESVRIGYVLLPGQGSLLIAGLAGRTPVNLDVQATGITCLPMQAEEGTVQVVLQTSGPFASPPVQLEPVQLTVDVQTVPSARLMEDWQLRTYQCIQRVYAAQRQAYEAPPGGGETAEAPQPRLNPRAVIRRQLRSGTTELLFQALREHLGPGLASPPSWGPGPWEVARPRYLRFFTRAFEWNELSYSFLQGEQDASGGRAAPRPATGEEGFQEFLEASYAQLLLPVRPDEVLAVLYFLASGMLWNGPAAWTAVHEDHVALALELKKLGDSPPVERVVSAPWEVLVPTSLSVLQEGSGDLEALCFPEAAAGPLGVGVEDAS
ncbi:hypothetical protein COCOR_06837 [Corallococcus coralloides DSM 2259]|uniref:Uncharacterized protein n=1 Tax=Corallococcus coralloides (strain ATCC 25202 / DSM 2259 / NBRC 100086 / M2) TaxID=1144275 RepID=H8N0Y2_CORCM|nr:hypothetical protein [Corallococcus coralloides]AFE07158.1 hypothetical protein COCOR_06837 [Corallococcus coralloides DSM 2259]